MAITEKQMQDLRLQEVNLNSEDQTEFELYDNSDDAFHEKDICVNDWINNHEKVFGDIKENNFDFLDIT